LSPSRACAGAHPGARRGDHRLSRDREPGRLGQGFSVLVHIEMADQFPVHDRGFRGRGRTIDAVLECRRMFGQPDYLLWVGVRDLAAYEKLYMSRLTGLPGVRTRETRSSPCGWSRVAA